MTSDLLFQSDSGHFELRFRGRLIFRASPGRPFLQGGRGRAEFSVSHGSYSIRDRALPPEMAGGAGSPASTQAGRRASASVPAAAGTLPRVLESSESLLRLEVPGLGIVRLELERGRLKLSFEYAEAGLNRLRLSLCAGPEEAVYGCGEQYSYFNLRGHRVPLWTEEQGVGRGPNLIKFAADLAMGAGGTRYSTYYPLPVFLSTARSGSLSCCCDSSAYAVFDFRNRDRYTLEFWELPRAVYIDVDNDPNALVSRLSELAGRQPALPDWALNGLLLGAQGGSAAVLEKLRILEDAGTPVTGIWAQDWCGRRVTNFGRQLMWNWEADPALYPDLPALTGRLASRGIRFLGYINPFLALEGSLYHEAHSRGFCVRNAAGSDYLTTVTSFPAATVDLTNPAAFEWIKDIIKTNMIGAGLSGWMADFGEYLPTDAVLYSGRSGELAHNEFPALWARANFEAVEEAGKAGEVCFFCRAGNIGSSRYAPAIWAGDQLVNWNRDDGLPSVLPAALSLGLCGTGVWHSDMGGYTTVGYLHRSRELLLRWAEFSAFTPIMRSHEGNRPDANIQPWSDVQTAAGVAHMARIHAALAPYAKAALRAYGAGGPPPMRPLFLGWPADTRCAAISSEYLYGNDLLVAPILRRAAAGCAGKTSRLVYLPKGDWTELWTGRVRSSGKFRVSAPLGQPPVFYRSDSEWKGLFEKFKGVE